MKALMKVAPTPGALEIRDALWPAPRADEVVIQVAPARTTRTSSRFCPVLPGFAVTMS
jgi:hypothetical protein